MSEFTDGRPDPIKLDFSSSSDRMIVAFGSLRMKTEVPPFEWIGVLRALPAKKIYIRDIRRFWYLKGLPRIADTPEGASGYLRHIITEQGSRRIVTFGGSMGGYAALLFGHLLEADAVVAFAPQTFLPSRRLHIPGFYQSSQIGRIFRLAVIAFSTEPHACWQIAACKILLW